MRLKIFCSILHGESILIVQTVLKYLLCLMTYKTTKSTLYTEWKLYKFITWISICLDILLKNGHCQWKLIMLWIVAYPLKITFHSVCGLWDLLTATRSTQGFPWRRFLHNPINRLADIVEILTRCDFCIVCTVCLPLLTKWDYLSCVWWIDRQTISSLEIVPIWSFN